MAFFKCIAKITQLYQAIVVLKMYRRYTQIGTALVEKYSKYDILDFPTEAETFIRVLWTPRYAVCSSSRVLKKAVDFLFVKHWHT